MKYVCSNNEVSIITFDHADFQNAKMDTSDFVFSGDGRINGNVKLKIGENNINCDSAVFYANGMAFLYGADVFVGNKEVLHSERADIDLHSDLEKR